MAEFYSLISYCLILLTLVCSKTDVQNLLTLPTSFSSEIY